MYKARASRHHKRKRKLVGWLALLLVISFAAFLAWLLWIRPMQRDSKISSFEDCARAGNPIQVSYPEVCLTKSGKRFVNPKQDAAHQASLDGEEELVPPSNPALLILDIEEWGLRVPLTTETFDLTYAYIESGGEERLLFTYKRFIRLDACKGDIGLTLTRSQLNRQPPYTTENPAPIAQIDKYYFYASHPEKQCYDAKNPEQTALAKQIAGDQTLTQATSNLLSKITPIPKD